MSSGAISKRAAGLLFAFAVLAWGINRVVAKVIVAHVAPLRAMAIPTALGIAIGTAAQQSKLTGAAS